VHVLTLLVTGRSHVIGVSQVFAQQFADRRAARRPISSGAHRYQTWWRRRGTRCGRVGGPVRSSALNDLGKRGGVIVGQRKLSAEGTSAQGVGSRMKKTAGTPVLKAMG
jgi:hypothetical protein